MKTFALSTAVAAFAAFALAAAETAPATNAVQTTEREQPKMADTTTVVMETSLGNVEILLDAVNAPITVANFLSYVDEKFYDGTVFHRVIKNFMVQGGGFTADLAQKRTKAPIKNEANNGLKNLRGTIAMARTQVVDSATAQFFINTVDNASLDFKEPSIRGFGYAVFGQVVAGMDVIDKISAVKTGSHGFMGDVPVEPVVIKTIRRK